MTKKRRRSHQRTRPTPAAAANGEMPDGGAETGRETAPPQRRGIFSSGFVDPAFPKIGPSLGRGFVTVGSSSLLLGSAFVLQFVLWVGLVTLGLEGPPGRLVNLLAIPPISTYFDALNGVTIYGFGGTGFLAATVFIAIRSVILAVLAGVVVQLLEGAGSFLDGVLRGVRAIPVVLTGGAITLSAMIFGSLILPVFGPGLGFLGSVLTLVAAMFFLVYVPVAAVRLDLSIAETIRRSGRAAMMPGSRHLLLCLLYVFLTLPILVAVAPGGSLLGVNPSVAMWAFALVATFVHLGFLATFAYRWIAAEDQIPTAPLKLRRR
jgi:hypothetical protein